MILRLGRRRRSVLTVFVAQGCASCPELGEPRFGLQKAIEARQGANPAPIDVCGMRLKLTSVIPHTEPIQKLRKALLQASRARFQKPANAIFPKRSFGFTL